MKKTCFRRKTLLCAIRAAALAFLCWIAAQRQAEAQIVGIASVPFQGSGATITTASGTYSGAFGFYDPNNSYNLTVGAQTSVTNTSASGYGNNFGYYGSSLPFATVDVGAGTVTNNGTIALNNTVSDYRFVTALALGFAGSASVFNYGNLASTSTETSPSQVVTSIGVNYTGSGYFNLLNAAGATISAMSNDSAVGIDAYAYGPSGGGAVAVTNHGHVSASGGASFSAYAVFLYSQFDTVTVVNTGTISATNSAYTAGIKAQTGNGALSIWNSGTVSSNGTNSGTGSNYGIQAYSNGAVTITNTATGSVTGTNSGTGSSDGNYGIYVNASGAVSVTNSGTVIGSGIGPTFGIYLVNSGTVYNTGTITAGSAIFVPSGSLVTLAGHSVINGIINGGNDGGSSSSILDFQLSVPAAALAADKSALNAAIALYAPGENGGNTYTFTINGLTYTIQDFGTVEDDLIGIASGNAAAQQFAQNFSQIAAQNPAFSSMASALGSLPATPQSTALLTALNSLPASELPAALAQLSTAKVSQQLLSQPASQAVFQNLQLDSRLTQVRSGFAGGIDANDFQLADVTQDPLLSQVQSKLYAYNPAPTNTVSDTPNSLSSDEKFARWGTFLSGNAVLSNQNATASQSRASSTTVDITAGADYRLNKNWAVGFLFGYGRTTASIDSFGSTLDGDQYRFGPYVGYNDGPWYANASGYFAVNRESSERVVAFLGQTAQSNPDGTQFGFNADGGYDFKAGHLTYGPTGGLQYTHLNVGAYTESGSDADLSVASQQSDSLLSSIGGKADYDLHWNWNNSTIRPEVRASWLHEFEGSNSPVNAAFDVPGSASFSMAAAHQERESALLGGGIQNIFPGGSLLFVDYDAQVQDNYLAQSITGGFKILF